MELIGKVDLQDAIFDMCVEMNKKKEAIIIADVKEEEDDFFRRTRWYDPMR